MSSKISQSLQLSYFPVCNEFQIWRQADLGNFLKWLLFLLLARSHTNIEEHPLLIFVTHTKYPLPFHYMGNWVKLIRFVCHLLYVDGWTTSRWLTPLLFVADYFLNWQIGWDCICLSRRGNLGWGCGRRSGEDAKFCWSIYQPFFPTTQTFLLHLEKKRGLHASRISWIKSCMCVRISPALPNHKISQRQKLDSAFE